MQTPKKSRRLKNAQTLTHININLIAVFTVFLGLNAVELSATSSSTATWGVGRGTLDYHVHPFNNYQFKSTLTLLFYQVLFCAAVTQSLLLTFLSFVLSCISACLFLLLLDFSTLWILIPPQCLRSPPAFSKTLSLFLSVSLPCMCLTDALSFFPLMFLSVSRFFSHNPTLVLISLYPSFPQSLSLSLSNTHTNSHTLSNSLSFWVAGRSKLACLSLKLQSYRAPWFISAIWVTHFCTNSHILMLWKYVKVFHHINFNNIPISQDTSPHWWQNYKVYSFWKASKSTSL